MPLTATLSSMLDVMRRCQHKIFPFRSFIKVNWIHSLKDENDTELPLAMLNQYVRHLPIHLGDGSQQSQECSLREG